VGVAVGVAGAQAGGADLDVDVGVLGHLADGDPAPHVAEPAADLGDHEMAADELD
jgi:hypothetical protein